MENVVGNSVLDQYFDDTTMSVHMKANRPVLQKKGKPGGWEPVMSDDIIAKKDLQTLIEKLYDEIEGREDGFLEIDRALSKVMQIGPYRIVVTHPPLADNLEMTVVKPVKRLTYTDYNMPEDVLELFKNQAKGILVSGAPGSGKTTFTQALVDLYHEKNHIIKTIESPRDLMVSDDVVQYSFTYGSHDEVRDILLLSRPDYTVYDEVRNKPDFELYKDLRLTGIGLLGVIHATRPVDSIQRFIGSIEMGIIPQVIDTVVFIDKGKIGEILQLQLTVKVPEGMESDDLARPVILVNSFFSKKVVYEIYTFGEQIVVMPLNEEEGGISKNKKKKTAVSHYAKHAIEQKLQQMIQSDFLVSVKGTDSLDLYVPAQQKARVIGKAGVAISELEKSIGLRIHVKTFDDLPLIAVEPEVAFSKKHKSMVLAFPHQFANKTICLMVGDELSYFTADNAGMVTIKKKSLHNAINKQGFVIVDHENV